MRTFRTLVVAVVTPALALALAPAQMLAAADACDHDHERVLHGQNHDYYVGVDGSTLTTYVYEESNGVAALQRGGASSVVPAGLDYDPCTDASDAGPDTLVF